MVKERERTSRPVTQGLAETIEQQALVEEREPSEDSVSLRAFFEAEDSVDEGFQQSLRPRRLAEFIGQERVRESLAISISAAKRRREPLDHILFHGPPGLGKTSLAAVVASELGVSFKATSGPVLEKPGDLAAILSSLGTHDVLFIDEVHRLNRVVEEILYPAMEDFQIDIIIGQGPMARSVKLNLKPFSLIAATTRTGLLTAPLRDRFGIVERIDFYTVDELTNIVERSAKILDLRVEHAGAIEIAKRSRGTPRVANRLLKRVRDYAEEKASGVVTGEVAARALELLQVDGAGLDKMDRLLMLTVLDKFSGGPVGLETLAAAIGEEKDTIEDVYEPYLIQQGFLRRTPRGREATELAGRYFNRNLRLGGSRELDNRQIAIFKTDDSDIS